MIKKVKDAIKKHGMLDKGEKVVVAVSGGPDSVALLKVLELISHEYELILIVAHLNHGLREEADTEEQFILGITEKMGIACDFKKVDINYLRKGTGKSTEDISRQVRYGFLNDVARKHQAQKIALGHHRGDQIETILMNFLRGSGPDGLKGILPVRDSLYIRPLLGIGREEIISFLDTYKIPFMTDTSNMEQIYLRNRIRHLLIPELKAKYNPNLEENLSNMAEILRLEDYYMKSVTDDILSKWGVGQASDEIRIRISDLKKHHEAIRNRIIRELLRRATPGSQGIGYIHIKAVSDLCFSHHPNGYLNLPHNILAKRGYDSLIISIKNKSDRKYNDEKYDKLHYEVALPCSVMISESEITIKFNFVKNPMQINEDEHNTVYMDYDRIVPPVIIRTVKPGDWIQPLGMKGKKKIKSCFIDDKVPLSIRKKSLLLIDQVSVIWIVGMKLNERVKITDKTTNGLKVEIV